MTIAAFLGLLGCQGSDQLSGGTGDGGDAGSVCNVDGSTPFTDPASGWTCRGTLDLSGLFSCTCTGPGPSPGQDNTDQLCAQSRMCAENK